MLDQRYELSNSPRVVSIQQSSLNENPGDDRFLLENFQRFR